MKLSLVKSKNKNIKLILNLILFGTLILFCTHVFAVDLLKDTETNLVDTIKGTGQKYLYISEFVVACLAWLSTRTVKAFFGVLILSAGANIILKVGGIL